MKEEIVVFETAKLAKEKGFVGCCNKYYNINNEEDYFNYYEGDGTGTSSINLEADFLPDNFQFLAPTQSLLQRWLREIHKCYVNAELNEEGKYIAVLIYIPKNQRDYWTGNFPEFEDALEFGLQEALKLIKQ